MTRALKTYRPAAEGLPKTRSASKKTVAISRFCACSSSKQIVSVYAPALGSTGIGMLNVVAPELICICQSAAWAPGLQACALALAA